MNEISKNQIDNLVLNAIPESKSLEYKESLSINDSEERREFLADVSAFANTAGGEIYYGVREARDLQGKSTGIPEAVVGLDNFQNRDSALLAIQDLIKDGLSPRIQGISYKIIDGFPQGPVLVLSIPESWRRPHQVILKNSAKFFARRMGGKYQMDIDEIRDAFLSSESIPERMRQFRNERIARILEQDTPMHLGGRGHIVYHFLPLSAMKHGEQIDLSMAMLQMPHATGINGFPRFNLDGVLACYTGASGSAVAYGLTQVFRNGIVEIIDSYTIDRGELQGFPGVYFVRPAMAEKSFFTAMQSTHNLYAKLGKGEETIFVFVSLMGVRGYQLYTKDHFFRGAPLVADRENLLFPDYELKELLEKKNRPLCDAFWQAFGADCSPHFDGAGQYQRPW